MFAPATPVPPAHHGRFRTVRALGEGGMGLVFEAEDLETGQHVALKTLRRPDAENLYRLKQEFRVLEDIHHPNLVRLYELIVEQDHCLLSMELIHGRGFLDYVRTRNETNDEAAAFDERCNEERLRAAIAQVAEGLRALHEAGAVHRDIKPANVLLTEDGRAVLIDFGLVASAASMAASNTTGEILGTAEYMAPEQAAGDAAITGAADMYALGVMIYEALAGRPPFVGSIVEVLSAKMLEDPRPLRDVNPHVPDDLETLCLALLAREPNDRPDAEEVLRRLSASGTKTSGVHTHLGATFVGREAPLRTLRESLGRVQAGEPVTVLISAEGGFGKTTLVHQFLKATVSERQRIFVLEGRCYEREMVPYKAMDNLIDDLSSQWLALDQSEADALVPHDGALLSRLFPVLARVPSIAAAPLAVATKDPQELRSRAFAALRSVFQKLATSHLLVCVLDDLQWVDQNTLLLLADLLRPPAAPRMLLVLSTRPAGSPALLSLAAQLGAKTVELPLGPLEAREAVALSKRLLGEDLASLAAKVASDAQGNPLFITELVRYVQSSRGRGLETERLEEILAERVHQLGEEPRRLLECLALIGEPVSSRSLVRASRMETKVALRALDTLRRERFARSTGDHGGGAVETVHSRMRAAVLGTLDDARRRELHASIAEALAHWNEATAERLFHHLLSAGQPERAALQARRAADEARQAFDFDRAAALYRLALPHGSWNAEELQAIWFACGETLSDAGRPLESARAFAEAMRDADPALRDELRVRNAGELLRGGYIVEGIDASRELLAQAGIRLSTTALEAIFWTVVYRVWVLVRGLRFTRKEEGEIPKAVLRQVDLIRSMCMSFNVIDTMRGAEYHLRYLRATLKLGEPVRLSIALVSEVFHAAIVGNERQARRAASIALEIADAGTSPLSRYAATICSAVIDYYVTNRWRRAIETVHDAVTQYRGEGGGSGLTVEAIRMMSYWCRLYAGDLAALSSEVSAATAEARRKGDRGAEVSFRTRNIVTWLVRDDTAGGERDVEEAIRGWVSPISPFLTPNFFAVHSLCEAALYRGDPVSAAKRLRDAMPSLRRSLLLTVLMVRAEVLYLEGRIELSRGALAPPDRRAHHARKVDKIAKKLGLLAPPVAKHTALLLEAGSLLLLGRKTEGTETLRNAIAALEAGETGLYAQPARYWLARITCSGDDPRVNEWATQAGIRDLHRLCAMLIPLPIEA